MHVIAPAVVDHRLATTSPVATTCAAPEQHGQHESHGSDDHEDDADTVDVEPVLVRAYAVSSSTLGCVAGSPYAGSRAFRCVSHVSQSPWRSGRRRSQRRTVTAEPRGGSVTYTPRSPPAQRLPPTPESPPNGARQYRNGRRHFVRQGHLAQPRYGSFGRGIAGSRTDRP